MPEGIDASRNWKGAYVEAGRGSNDYANRTAQRVREVGSYAKLEVTTESVTFAAGAAGTTGVVSLANTAIYDSTGSELGRVDDTSFSWTTGTILDTEVPYIPSMTDAEQFAELANGEYAMNYDSGKIRYKKGTSGTSDSANYISRILSSSATFTGTISLGSAKLEDGATTTKGTINAANTVRTSATTVLVVQPIGADGTILSGQGTVKISDGVTPTNLANVNPANTARTSATVVIAVQPLDASGNVITGSGASATAIQPLGTLASGTATYQTLLTPSANATHISLALNGSNDAIVSLDAGTTDQIYVVAGSVNVLDSVSITASVDVMVKNAVSGDSHGKLNGFIW